MACQQHCDERFFKSKEEEEQEENEEEEEEEEEERKKRKEKKKWHEKRAAYLCEAKLKDLMVFFNADGLSKRHWDTRFNLFWIVSKTVWFSLQYLPLNYCEEKFTWLETKPLQIHTGTSYHFTQRLTFSFAGKKFSNISWIKLSRFYEFYTTCLFVLLARNINCWHIICFKETTGEWGGRWEGRVGVEMAEDGTEGVGGGGGQVIMYIKETLLNVLKWW